MRRSGLTSISIQNPIFPFFVLLIVFSSCALLRKSATTPEYILWYEHPAERWEEALPLGNGRLGAMVFGGVTVERIQLNEDTFWSGGPYDPINTEAYTYLPKVRQLIARGRFEAAQKLADEKLMGEPRYLQCYQPLADLHLTFPGHENPSDYRRELDLNEGIARIQYRIGDVTYRREIFSSAPDQVMVMRLTCDKPGKLDFFVVLDSQQSHRTQTDGSNRLVLSGRWRGDLEDPRDHLKKSEALVAKWYGDGLEFEVHLAAVPESGSIIAGRYGLRVKDTDAVTLVLAAATNYAGKSPSEACIRDLMAVDKPYAGLLSDHERDYQALFNRVSLDVGSNENEVLPTDERLEKVRKGEADPQLAALYFQFGRYLLMSSSRPGTQPANLQGIWNKDRLPAWGSKYTININTEMNYWPAEVTNLAECHEPLFDLIESLRESGRRTARVHYNCGGFVAHHNTDLWRVTTPVDGARWGLWPMGAAWLSLHLWEHYAFGVDRDFLQRYYPTLKEAAQFLLDFLIEDDKGRLVTSPSHSPENAFIDEKGNVGVLCIGATMDLEIIHALFTRCVDASEILDEDPDFRDNLNRALDRLAPLQIGKHGQLQEWLEDYDEQEPGHRHMSHLFGLHPGNQITPRGTPDLAQAARVSLERRLSQGGGHTGWSRAWIINFFARLEDGEKAHENFIALISRSTLPNLFDNHPPFQIDGNFGATAGIAEMLLQSHTDELVLLPALPEEWSTGSVTGLRGRGGFTVDMIWENMLLKRATIHSSVGESCKVRYGEKTVTLKTDAGGRYVLDGELNLK